MLLLRLVRWLVLRILVPRAPDETHKWYSVGLSGAAACTLLDAQPLHALLHPDDIYDETGTYWADLPMRQRLKFVTKVDGAEARKETKSILAMFKEDPLSPIGYYMKNMVLPGAGLGLEGYVLLLLLLLFSSQPG